MKGFAPGFIIGVVAGAVLAYAMMQEDARDLIVGKAKEAGNFAKDATGDLRDLYSRGKNLIDSASEDQTWTSK